MHLDRLELGLLRTGVAQVTALLARRATPTQAPAEPAATEPVPGSDPAAHPATPAGEEEHEEDPDPKEKLHPHADLAVAREDPKAGVGGFQAFAPAARTGTCEDSRCPSGRPREVPGHARPPGPRATSKPLEQIHYGRLTSLTIAAENDRVHTSASLHYYGPRNQSINICQKSCMRSSATKTDLG